MQVGNRRLAGSRGRQWATQCQPVAGVGCSLTSGGFTDGFLAGPTRHGCARLGTQGARRGGLGRLGRMLDGSRKGNEGCRGCRWVHDGLSCGDMGAHVANWGSPWQLNLFRHYTMNVCTLLYVSPVVLTLVPSPLCPSPSAQVLPKGYDQRAQDMWSVGVTLACLWFAELPVVDRGGGGGTDRGGTDREGQPQTPKTQGQLQQQQQHSLQSSPQKPQQGEYGGQEGTREGERGAGEEGGGLSAEERRLEEQWQRWRKGGYCVGVEVEAEAEVLPGAVGEGEGGGGGGSGGGGGVRWQRWRTGGSHAEAEAGAGALGSVVMMHNGLAMEEGVGGAGEEGQEGGDGEGRPSATTGGCSYGRLGPGGGLYGGNLSAKSDTGMGLGTGGRLSNGCSGGGGGVGSGGGGGGGSGGGLGGLGDSNYSWTSCRSQFQEPQPNHLHQHHQQQQQLQQAGSLPNGQLPNGHRNAAGGPPGSSTGGGSNGTFPTVSAPPSGGGGDPSPAAASADPTALPPFLAAAGFRSLPTTVGACGLPMSPAFLDLLSGLLRPRHRDRLTCGQALEHTWVRCVLTDGGGGGGAGAGLQASQRDGEGNTVRLGGGGNTVGGRMGVPEPLSAAVRGRREAGGGEQGQGRGRGRAQQGGMRAVASASAFGSS